MGSLDEKRKQMWEAQEERLKAAFQKKKDSAMKGLGGKANRGGSGG